MDLYIGYGGLLNCLEILIGRRIVNGLMRLGSGDEDGIELDV